MTVGQAGSKRLSVARSQRWIRNGQRPEPNSSHGALRNYERYMALARAEDQNGNTVGAENFYQYAEHYLRCLSPDTEAT
jgi:hypothetical protein